MPTELQNKNTDLEICMCGLSGTASWRPFPQVICFLCFMEQIKVSLRICIYIFLSMYSFNDTDIIALWGSQHLLLETLFRYAYKLYLVFCDTFYQFNTRMSTVHQQSFTTMKDYFICRKYLKKTIQKQQEILKKDNIETTGKEDVWWIWVAKGLAEMCAGLSQLNSTPYMRYMDVLGLFSIMTWSSQPA